ncbi:hypothetical protein IAD21_00046 [Abditibacteriota bacterium]|nr:hypothetical protein IAD21_00046 [Abditibacteriota bacterium]
MLFISAMKSGQQTYRRQDNTTKQSRGRKSRYRVLKLALEGTHVAVN